MEDLCIAVRRVDGAVVVKFSGNFDYDLDHVNEELVERELSGSVSALVLDMANVKKIASAFINRLVKVLRFVEKEKRKLFLLNVSEPVIKVLSMVNIIGRFPIIHSEEELVTMSKSNGVVSSNSVVMKVNKLKNGDSHTLVVEGSIVEGANTSELLEEVKASLAEGVKSVVVDFEKVDILDTISVGFLLMVQKMCEEKGVAIKIEHPNEVASHVLEMNEVGRLFGL